MSLILKQEPANTIATPPAGKSTIFVNDVSVLSIKTPAGAVQAFPTIGGSNTQVLFNDNGAISGDGNLVFNKTNGLLTVEGLTVIGSVTANINGNAVAAGTANTVTSNAQPNITSTGTLTTVSVSGNATIGNLSVTGTLTAGDISVSSISNGTSNVDIIGVSGNVTTSVGGVANILVVTGTGANVTGTFSASGNANAGNFGTGGLITATGNVTGANIITGGIVSATGNVSGSNFITTNAVEAGTLTVSGVSTLGAVGNVRVTGGTSGQVMSTDGTGNLSFISISSSGISNGTSNVTVLSSGNITMSSAGNANVLVVTGTGVSVNGNVEVGNLIGAVANGNSNVAITANGNVNISAVGIANVFVVTSTGVNVSGILSATGNVLGARLISSGIISATGNLSAGNISTSGLITATGNVRGANLVTGGVLSVTGNANIGNLGVGIIEATTISASGNVTGGNLTTAGILSVTGTGISSIAGNLNINGKWVNNVGYPVLASDAASKQYVDTIASTGIAYHQSVLAATTTTLDSATGGTVSYNNGTAGVGATLTTTGTFLLIDGANVQTVGTRILVKDEANAAFNGIYEYTSTTVITRTADADEYGPDSATQLSVNDYFFTTGGVVNEGVSFIVSAPTGTITFGTSNITFATFSTSQVYNAGTGIAITGTVISANASQTQITAVGTLTTLSVAGNAAVGNLVASGGSITGANLVSANFFAGTLTTAAQPNITSVGILSSVSVTGNIDGANITGTHYGAATGLTSIPGANVTGTVPSATVAASANAVAGANVTGAVSFATTANAVAVANVSGIGNIATINLDGNLSNLLYGNGVFASAPVAYGNSNVATFLASYGSNTITTTGNVSFGNLVASNISTGAATGGNITGANLISANYFTGTLTTAAQPNITSTGTLTSLIVSGTTNLGAVGNVTITGGTANQFLQTNGSGTLAWATAGGGSGPTTAMVYFMAGGA